MEALAASLGCTDSKQTYSSSDDDSDPSILYTGPSLSTSASGSNGTRDTTHSHPHSQPYSHTRPPPAHFNERIPASRDSTPTRFIVDPPHHLLKAGHSSPSQVCLSRKLSTAIATKATVNHPALEGRPTLLVPAVIVDQRPPKDRMGLFRSSRSNSSGSNSTGKRSSATTDQEHPARAIAPSPYYDDDGNTSKPQLQHPSATWAQSQFQNIPSPLRQEAWSEPSADAYNVRSRNYMSTSIKVASAPSAFRLLSVDLINVDKPLYGGICSHPEERFQQALLREKETGVKELPEFVFAVNLCVPGQIVYHFVVYFGIDDMDEIYNQSSPFGKLMYKFMFGDSDQFRNKTFKLIPRVVEGNFVVRKAVGSKPSILGKKIKQYYIRGERFFEVIVDISSDSVAQKIVRLALGCTKNLVVDMMYVLEGTDEETLPERIFGGIRVKNIDFKHKDGKRSVQQHM